MGLACLEVDLRAFKDLRNKLNNLMNATRGVFYKDLSEDSKCDQKKLFSITRRLLGVERDSKYRPFEDKVVLLISLVIFSFRRFWSYKTSLITWLRQYRMAARSV